MAAEKPGIPEYQAPSCHLHTGGIVQFSRVLASARSHEAFFFSKMTNHLPRVTLLPTDYLSIKEDKGDRILQILFCF
ncbi:MAG: hypothetical protein LUQ66_03160 [Methanoregula sp.]|nr:hypothetical protein [Methanoregula sp.]